MTKPTNNKKIEQVKTVSIVVLFFMTVLLLYFFWENQFFDDFQFPDIKPAQQVNQAPTIDEVLVPDSIYVSLGSGAYASVPENKTQLWEEAITEFTHFGEASSVLVSEITEGQYNEAMVYPSICFNFSYEIPFLQFCDYYGIQKSQSFDAIDNVASIAYSTASVESIFIFEKSNKKYYRLLADKDYTKFKDMIAQIQTMGYINYYPTETFFGVKNSHLLPLSTQSNNRSLEYQREQDENFKETTKNLAESFFGESFDFVRRIIDSKGNITYMYGYGQKIFIVYKNGTFEYKEENNDAIQGQARFYESLDTALQFVASHGSWKTFGGTNMDIVLSDAKMKGKDKKKAYHFEFQMRVGDAPLYYENGAAVIVEVSGGKVTYYKRDYIDFDSSKAIGQEREGIDPVNTIAANYDFLYQMLAEKKASVGNLPEKERFDEVAGYITDMREGYLRIDSEEEKNHLSPAWVVTLDDDLRVFFDLYTGELLSSEKQVESGGAK